MRRVIAGILTLCLTAGLMLGSASAKDYGDIQDHWGKEAIRQVTDLGFFSGTGEDTFSPDVSMTRGMFVTVLAQAARWMNLSAEGTADAAFTDVSADAYYAAPVAWAYENGLAAGVGGGLFQPDAPITREQMCTMLVRFLSDYAGFDLSQYETDSSVFLDQNSISAYAKETVGLCYHAGLISGVAVSGGVEFQPTALASRAAVAVVLAQVAGRADSWEKAEPANPQEPDKELPSGGGAGVGGGTAPVDPSKPDEPTPDEPTEEEKALEAEVSGYLETMVKRYQNALAADVKKTDQEVQDCLAILMDCIGDALEQRAGGQFLSRAYIKEQYADQVAELKEGYGALTKEQKIQLNNVIIRMETTTHIYAVMDYFGVDYLE